MDNNDWDFLGDVALDGSLMGLGCGGLLFVLLLAGVLIAGNHAGWWYIPGI